MARLDYHRRCGNELPGEFVRIRRGTWMSRVRAARNRDKESRVRDQPLQRLFPPTRPQQPLGVPGDVPWPGIAADQFAEKGVLAQRNRFGIQQLLEGALHRLAL